MLDYYLVSVKKVMEVLEKWQNVFVVIKKQLGEINLVLHVHILVKEQAKL